jgi:hypothetical protein
VNSSSADDASDANDAGSIRGSNSACNADMRDQYKPEPLPLL